MVPPPLRRTRTMQNQTHATPDNLLGVCHAVGATFGFNPLCLRLLLLVGVMLNAEAALAAYAVLGIAVAASRLLTWRAPAKARRETLVAA